MSEFYKTSIPLAEDHAWSAPDGFNIFVMDRGAVLFNFPNKWNFEHGEKGSIRFFNKETRKDSDGEIEISYVRMPGLSAVNLDNIPFQDMLGQLEWVYGDGEPIEIIELYNIAFSNRIQPKIAWLKAKYIERNEQREAYCIRCIALDSDIHCTITSSYWVDYAEEMQSVWDEFIGSLTLNKHIQNPAIGK